MGKIVLNRRRNFADVLSMAFLFPKQEFKPFLKTFCVLVLPLILVDLIFQSVLVRTAFGTIAQVQGTTGESVGQMLGQSMTAVVSQLVLFFWLCLVTLSYLRVYQDNSAGGEPGTVAVHDVWRVMKHKLLPYLLFGVIYLLIGCLTTLLLIIPGIYFGIAFQFGMYLIVLRDKSIGDGFSSAFIRGHWWSTFGLLLLLYLMVGVLSYMFSLPYVILTVTTMLTASAPDPWLLTLSLLISNLGKYLLSSVFVIGMGFQFYNIAESREHTALYRQIESLGDSGSTADAQVD